MIDTDDNGWRSNFKSGVLVGAVLARPSEPNHVVLYVETPM